MKFLLRVTLWCTVGFVVAWVLHPSWEHAIGAIGARLAAPPGSTIEIEDLELFYPFDLAIFVGMCAASTWAGRARRGRAMLLGLPVLIAAEVLSLVITFRVLMNAGDPATAERLTNAVLRVSGVALAAVAWLILLGQERLSLARGAWSGSS